MFDASLTISVQLRLNQTGFLHWLQWDDEYVVFDEASGLTHHLDAPTARALMCVEDGATDMDLLVEKWGASGSDADTVRAALPFILEQLTGANLIDVSRE